MADNVPIGDGDVSTLNTRLPHLAVAGDVILGLVVAAALFIYALFYGLAIGDSCHRASTVGTATVIFAPAAAWLVVLTIPVVRGQTLGLVLMRRAAVTQRGRTARLRIIATFSFWGPVLMTLAVISLMSFSLTPAAVIGAIAVVLALATGPLARRFGLTTRQPIRIVARTGSLRVISIQFVAAASVVAALTVLGNAWLATCPPMLSIVGAPVVDTRTGNLYVTDAYAGLIMVSGRTGHIVRAGPLAAHQDGVQVVVDQRSEAVYAAVTLDDRDGHPVLGQVVRLDPATGRPLRWWRLQGAPNNIAVAERAGRVFVPDKAGTILVLDSRTGRTMRTLHVGGQPGATIATDDGANAVLLASEGERTFHVLDARTGAPIRRIQGFADVTDVLVDTRRHRALLFGSIIGDVPNSGLNEVGLLDLRTGSYHQLPSRDVPGGGLGPFVVDQPSDRIFAADDGSDVQPERPRIELLDLATGRRLRSIAVAAQSVALDPDTHRVYTADGGSILYGIDTGAGRVVQTINVGGASAQDVAYDQQSRHLFASSSEGGVATVDPVRGTVISAFSTYGVAAPPIDPRGGRLFAIAEDGIHILSTHTGLKLYDVTPEEIAQVSRTTLRHQSAEP